MMSRTSFKSTFCALCGACLFLLGLVSLGSFVAVATVLLVHEDPPCSAVPTCPTCPACPGAAATPATQAVVEYLRLGLHRVTLDTYVAEIMYISYLWRRESRALTRTTFLQTEWA